MRMVRCAETIIQGCLAIVEPIKMVTEWGGRNTGRLTKGDEIERTWYRNYR